MWNELVSLFPSERAFFTISIFVCHSLVFIGLGCLFEVARNRRWWKQYQINSWGQQQKYLTPELVNHGIRTVIFNHLLSPLGWWIAYPYFVDRGLTVYGPLPSISTIISQFLICFLIEDTLFYWSHRLLHHPWFYKRFHKQHHEFKVTIAFAFAYAHPVDIIFTNYIPSLIGVYLLGVHHLTLLLWLCMRVQETMEAHCGYEFPYSPWNICHAIQGGAARHDFHHSHNVGNYGSFTTIWDRIMKTDTHWIQYKANQEAKKKQNKER